MQGGLLFLETKAVEKFICSFASYYHFASNILFGKQTYTKKTEHSVDMTILDDRNVIERTLDIPLQDKEKRVQALTINVSQLTTVLMIEDEKGLLDTLSLYYSYTCTNSAHIQMISLLLQVVSRNLC